MTVLKVFSGANDQKWQVKYYLNYITDSNKHFWNDLQIPANDMIHGYGLSIEPALAAEEILGLHRAFGYPGNRYFYHVLVDFSAGYVDPWQTAAYGWEINDFLRRQGLQYIQGVHCVKGHNIFQPHLHIMINALQPINGTKLHMGFDFIRNFKIFANYVCAKYKVPLIVLGKMSMPFYIK